MNRGLLKMSLVLITGLALLVGGAAIINAETDAPYDFTFTYLLDLAFARGINNAGDIVGYALGDYPSTFRGFLLSEGNWTWIDFPGCEGYPGDSYFTGINDVGDIVGYYHDCPESGGYLLRDGTFTRIDFPGAVSSRPQDINNAGQIVGHYYDDYLAYARGFLLSGGSFTTIDVPGAATTWPYGINDAGEIVGTYATRHGSGPSTEWSYHGFLLSGGSFTTVNFPGYDDALVHGINNAGQIVGHARGEGGPLFGFLLSDGSFTRIDIPEYEDPKALGYDINDAVWIVGRVDHTGSPAFLARLILGQMVRSSGDVSISGSPATIGDPIHAGDLVGVGEGGLAAFKMRLKEMVQDLDKNLDVGCNSEVKIREESTASEITLELFKGKIRGRLRDLPEGIRFDMLTPVAEIGVRGTEWIVEVDETSTLVSVLEGSVEVSSRDAADGVIVEENHQVQATSEGIGEPYAIDPNEVDRWWSAHFVFLPLVLK